MMMLALDAVDLDVLAEALEDNSHEGSWWINPTSGAIDYCSVDDDADEFEERGLAFIDPIDSHEAYDDMASFVNRVRASRPRDLLERAIQGRGAFRRFKDTLFEFPDLRQEWFAFHDRRMRERALRWLADSDLVAAVDVERAIADMGAEENTPLGPADVAAVAATELRALYGGRLVDVIIFGSHARGDADADSDLDLLVVLDGEVAPFEELRRMDDTLWRLSFANDITVSAHPVSRRAWQEGRAPVLLEARRHGVTVS